MGGEKKQKNPTRTAEFDTEIRGEKPPSMCPGHRVDVSENIFQLKTSD